MICPVETSSIPPFDHRSLEIISLNDFMHMISLFSGVELSFEIIRNVLKSDRIVRRGMEQFPCRILYQSSLSISFALLCLSLFLSIAVAYPAIRFIIALH